MTMQNMQPNARIDARQAAEILGVSPYTVRRWARNGALRYFVYPSGRMYFRRADIEVLLTPVGCGVSAESVGCVPVGVGVE